MFLITLAVLLKCLPDVAEIRLIVCIYNTAAAAVCFTSGTSFETTALILCNISA